MPYETPPMMDSYRENAKWDAHAARQGGTIMPSISTMLGLISQLESPFITVHQERCILVRNRNADCLRCAQSCTSGCIHYDGEELTISPEKCIGCGTCATVCPTCALEAHHPADADLENRAITAMRAASGHACIACGQLLDAAAGLYDAEKVVRVECLGRVEDSLVTTLVANGAHDVSLVRGKCESCDHTTGWECAKAVVETEKRLLETWKSDAVVKLTHKLPGSMRATQSSYNKAKRALFAEDRKELLDLGAKAADATVKDALGVEDEPEPSARYMKVMEDGTLAHFVPDRRARLLDALAEIGEPSDVDIATRLWGHVVIDQEKCTSCRMCATFCPTAAITKFQDPDGTFGVEHYPGDCAKCRCCEEICPAGAIEVRDDVNARSMLEGRVERFEMEPPIVERDQPHAIWHTMRTMMKTDQVYER